MTGPEIAIAVECADWNHALPDAEELCRRVAAITLASALQSLPPERCEISLVLGDDALVQRLNLQYRGQDKPTNVLSFAALDDDEAPIPEEGPVLLGDVIVAYQTAVAEAEAEGKSLSHHLSHLVVHGVLHLLGHDHIEDDEAEEMEGIERSILAALGIQDPYAAEERDAPI